MSDLDPYAPPPEHTDCWRDQEYISSESVCIECGQRGSLRCGCCGFLLCGKHHELGEWWSELSTREGSDERY